MSASGRRRWVTLAAALLTTLVTARLGWWQLDRADQKLALQRSLDQRGGLPALGALDLRVEPDHALELHHRGVELRGRWLAERTVFLDNRPMAGRAGFIVVTPLALEPGPDVVLVQRGWLPRDVTERTRLPAFQTAAGAVTVTGRVAGAPSRLVEFDAAPAGAIRQNLDIAGYAREIGVPLVSLTVVESGAASDGLLRHWPPPAIDVHKHYGYALQWFGLAALVVGLTAWFQFIRPRRTAGLPVSLD